MKNQKTTPVPQIGGNAFSAAITIVLLCICAVSACAQVGASQVTLPFQITNNHDRTASLIAGVHEFGTKGLDASLGEYELPPVPPSEIFDARFVPSAADIKLGEGSLIDYRPWRASTAVFSETYRVSFAAGRTWPSVTLKLPATWSASIKQVRISGKAVNAGDSVVSTIATGTMTIVVDFDLNQVKFTANPTTLSFALSNRDTTVPATKPVQITPDVAGASWRAESDQGWITIDPGDGSGAGTISIGLANMNFQDGRTSGEVRIFNAPDDAPTIVTVNVDMVTGVETAASADDFLMVNLYPNPFVQSRASGMTIAVRTQSNEPIAAEIVDVLGRRIAVLPDFAAGPGERHLVWNPAGLQALSVAPGVYVLRIGMGEKITTRTFVVQR
jgi:hypothetical protein